MICINCFHKKTAVANSRGHKKESAIWRRRKCPSCQTIFTTYELPSLTDVKILTPRGLEPFSFSKLLISIANSFRHNQHAADYESFYLTQTIQQRILIEIKSPSTEDIAAIAHDTLKKYDPVAAVQYAAQHDMITSRRRAGRPSTVFSPPWHDHSSQP